MRRLRLDRALVCFDLETTGTDIANDRIVEIGIIRVEPLGLRRSFRSLVNPERPIPPEASAVHGIRDEDVRDQPTLAELADEIHSLFEDADLAGFNSTRFDLPLLAVEMERIGRPLDLAGRRHVDAMAIFHLKEPRDLSAAYRFYCGKELENAHSALADVEATLEVLDAQLERYDDLPRDLDGLHRLCNPDGDRFLDVTRKIAWNDEGEAVLAFGKHRGTPLRRLAREQPDYVQWMLGKDFSPQVKRILSEALEGRFPRREA
ncbi:MAG: 3'-5' exonuclease [Acidobacteriota bacterium]|nr:MAG: 3'-5' exonuclease [Acidobacteriota bacterium]